MLLTPEFKNKLNSLTKYPKILTYHMRDNRGLLMDWVTTAKYPKTAYVHEKFDGENTRITVLPTGEYLIGSRDEWLTISGDRFWNQKDGLVDTLRPFADKAIQVPFFYGNDTVTTFHCEVYGHKASDKWRNYGDGTPAVRLFDVSRHSLDNLDLPIEQIAAEREHRQFAPEGTWSTQADLTWVARYCEFTPAELLQVVDGSEIPDSIEEMHAFISQWPTTSGATTGPGGPSEGVVLSDENRLVLRKVKFRDYTKILDKRAEEKRLAEKDARRTAFEAGRRGE